MLFTKKFKQILAFGFPLGLIVSLILLTAPFFAWANSDDSTAKSDCFLVAVESPFAVDVPEHDQVTLNWNESYDMQANITYSKAYKSDVSYSWEYSADGGKTWISLAETSDKLHIEGYVPGDYQFRLTAKDTLGNVACETWFIKITADGSDSNSSDTGDSSITQSSSTLSKTGDTLPYASLIALCAVIILTSFVLFYLCIRRDEGEE